MDENIAAFLKVLDPSDDATGGGTASAIAGAMAAALVGMVARLSIGKEGMEEERFYRALGEEAEALARQLFDGGREDSQAFDAVRAAYHLPKDSDEAKAERRRVIREALVEAARVPLGNAEHCWRALELAHHLEGRSNPHAASDLECAVYLAHAGLMGCLANVKINLESIEDQEAAQGLGERAGELARMLEATGVGGRGT